MDLGKQMDLIGGLPDVPVAAALHPFGNRHEDGDKDEWLTPPEIIKALGAFDLDPCAPMNRPWDMAAQHYTIEDNGLSKVWKGRVWLNPPYGRATGVWLNRLAVHGNGIGMIFARTDTEAFFSNVWKRAFAVFFFAGRLDFYHLNGLKAKNNAGAPSCLVAYGWNNVAAIAESGLCGKLIVLKK